MCIICVSRPGVRLPNRTEIEEMFFNNPHGAGYMFARDGRVIIHKGFMNIDDFLRAFESEGLTEKDSVVCHFRISTQAGVNPEMTHPFPLSNHLGHMKALDLSCPIGVAHNGIIPLTTDRTQHEYSDTALFIAKYLSNIISRPEDLRNQDYLDIIERMIQSKMVLMDGDGYIATIGHFIKDRGLLYSNASYLPFGGFAG